MKNIISKLQKLNIEISNTEPYTDLTDAAIYLGGLYDGIHISIGDGYYSVVKACEDGCFLFVDGKGNLEAELQDALNSNE
jgi:hypothetical protein